MLGINAVTRNVLSIGACLLTVLGLGAFIGPDNNGIEPVQTQIIIKRIINQVETEQPRAQHPESVGFSLAQVGEELLPGDAVKTFLNSEARVDISIGEVTRITRTTPNTTWRLGRFAMDGETVIELDQGKIFLFDDGQQEGHVEVQVVTPAGTASPRGTWMSVEHDPQTGVTQVQCFRAPAR